MAMRRCEGLSREKMEMRRCTSGLAPEEKQKSGCDLEGKSVLYVLKGADYHIIKLDLSRHLFTPTSSPRYIGSSKATRPQPPLPLRNRRSSLHRFSRFLHTANMNRWKRSDLGQIVPKLPQPYLKVDLPLPEEVAVVALGSKIYFFGGRLKEKDAKGWFILPREVYAIDTAREPPEMVKLSCLLNYGKRIPIAWTVGGKIYAMPSSFTPGRWNGYAQGKVFEFFDPQSNMWTLLPDPPFQSSAASPAGFEILSEHNRYEVSFMRDPQGVESHAVLGSTLVISLAEGGVYAFDTDRRAWRRIFLQLSPRVLLNFLPFESDLSVSVADDLVLCSPQFNDSGDFLSEVLEREVNIKWSDSYICRFTNNDESEILNVSIEPLDWNRESTRWFKFVQSFSISSVIGGPSGIGDRVFMFARNGHDYNFGVADGDKGHYYFSLNLFRLSNDSYNYETSELASALFRSASISAGPGVPYRCFVMEKGVFTH